MILTGADSANPHNGIGKDVWCIYIAGEADHIWTPAQAKTLPVKAVLPIVVPPQDLNWWLENGAGAKTLVNLVAESRKWGLLVGAPLCLDIEQHQAEAMTKAERTAVALRWLGACHTYGYIPWSYGGALWHEETEGLHRRWLASWQANIPTALPEGFNGHQYAGNVSPGIDLDIFDPTETYLSVNLKELYVPTFDKETGALISDEPEESDAAPVAEPSPVTPEESPVVATAEHEETNVTSAIEAEVHDEQQVAEEPAAPSQKARLLSLLDAIETHLGELHALASELE